MKRFIFALPVYTRQLHVAVFAARGLGDCPGVLCNMDNVATMSFLAIVM